MRNKTYKALVPEQVKKRKRWSFFKRVFLIIVVIFATIQLYKMNRILSQIQGGDLREITQLQEDINDVRRFLDLPVQHSEDLESQVATLESELFSVVTGYKQDEESKKRSEQIKAAYQEAQALPALLTLIDNEDYNTVEDFNFTMILHKGEDLVSFGIEESALFIETPEGKSYPLVANFKTELQDTLSNDTLKSLIALKEKLSSNLTILNSIKNDTDIAKLLDTKDLKIEPAKSILANVGLYEAKIVKLDDSVAGGISYSSTNNNFYVTNETGVNVSGDLSTKDALTKAVVKYLEEGEFLTLLDQDVNEAVKQVETLIKSEAFKAALEDAGLRLASLTETTEFTIFNFKEGEDTKLRILIDKKTAQVYSEQDGTRVPLNVSIQADLSSTDGVKKNDKINFLIAGKHGSLTDTIIFAHVDQTAKSVKLISIPRDLYIDNKKINSLYLDGGMPALVQRVEEITGMQIVDYVMIDMYAFIDVVDYLGGIDVTLDQPLIDPTYKTYDEGEWGTLYYEAGTHHLSGVQALRIARSRHYSSDFDRAKRQHKILYALREKGKNLSIKDAGKLLQIAVTLLNKTDTDMSAKDALNYFLKYKNYSLEGQHVLSSGNVLTSTYSNIYNGSVPASCTDCFKGAYILTPKNNDWRLVRSYIYNILRN